MCMASSNDDIALTITSNGKSAFYSSVKGCGNLLAEVGLGIYSDAKPDPFKAFSFTKKGDWNDTISKRKTPLQNPIYGFIDIDFDLKEVRYNNGYGVPNIFFFEWVYDSVRDAVNKKEGYISKKSIIEHIKNNRIHFFYYAQTTPIDFFGPADLNGYFYALELLLNSSDISPSKAIIDLPPTWKLINTAKVNK